MRKRRHPSPSKSEDGAKKGLDESFTPDGRSKRNRTKVQLYQSPTPEIAMATKLSASAGRATPTKSTEDKLIVFYKNEYLAVRNPEGSFYICQAMQNVYRNSRKIKIRWLSQDKTVDPSGHTYKPDFYDVTDMECVLTTLSMQRASGGCQVLRPEERTRATSILERALQAERGSEAPPRPTPEHPDGLDLSLYTDEAQLEKKFRKRPSTKTSPRTKAEDPLSLTATAVTEKSSKPKASPAKASPAPAKHSPAKLAKSATAAKQAKVETPSSTPTRKGRRATRETKSTLIVPTPSTSTGKTTRTPRKPPAKK